MLFSFFFIIPGMILLYFIIEYSVLIPAPRGIVVLMYHQVSSTETNALCVSIKQLDKQLDYIQRKGYNIISFDDLKRYEDQGQALPKKPVIISFDDGYKNNLNLACPLLEKYRFPAIFFLTTAFLGKTNTWDKGAEPIMDISDLHTLSAIKGMHIGLHSHNHINYERSSLEDVERDLGTCMEILEKNAIPFCPVLAYPYGKYPLKNKQKRADMDAILKKSGIRYALRIGSKINRLPITSPYTMTRTNIRGDESFFTFTIKLKKGRAKLFK